MVVRLYPMLELSPQVLCGLPMDMGAACVAGVPAPVQSALQRFGEALGLAFQVVDDVLDVTADSATLGKGFLSCCCRQPTRSAAHPNTHSDV